MATDRDLGRGLSESVRDSQAIFRAVMDAMARPGTRRPLPTPVDPPAGLTQSLAAIALALADFETPIWLDIDLAEQADVVRYLRFFSGAPLTADPSAAAIALVSNPTTMPTLESFAQGTLEYPDRSTTVVVMVEAMTGGDALVLRGPGIKTETSFAPRPQPPQLVEQLALNRTQFPRGVDLIFVSPSEVAALPRSLHVSTGA
ncbi:MAG: phosphonate C-P lyase system protein PhnH [Hyphomicrobiaceae bacterium]|nr:phosphonate C-P lyase system protein PhnH [Hyphomicrobiaceae bacterium]